MPTERKNLSTTPAILRSKTTYRCGRSLTRVPFPTIRVWMGLQMTNFSISFVQHGTSLAFKTFHDLLGILRLDSNFFQGCAKVLEKQIKVPVVQTFIS